MSQGSRGRNPDETARTIERWLANRLGVREVRVDDITIPKAGFSNETLLGRASWIDQSATHQREFVARIEPTSNQLFTAPDAIRQASVMAALRGQVPVPTVWLTEEDRSVLGAPFFLMDRVHGRIPSDVPSWHKRGWTSQLAAEEQRALHEYALRSLVALHAVTPGPELAFLADGQSGGATALDHYLRRVQDWYEWCAPVRVYDSGVIDDALRYVIEHQPRTHAGSIVWGDARVGNLIFADDLSVAAMLDWEGATFGPPEIDVAWWVMFDEFLCEAQGFARLPGVEGRTATFALYEQLSGTALEAIEYYEILAGLVLALINCRLANLLIRDHVVDEATASEYVTRITTMTARRMNQL